MISSKLKGALGAGVLAVAVAASAVPAQAATTFTVVDAADHGSGTLRDQINALNKSTAKDAVMKFKIPGAGVHTIKLASPLPAITRQVTIDGYSQAGAVKATADDPAKLKLVLDAEGQDTGLALEGDDVVVQGLDIQDALGDGVVMKGSGDVVSGNHIGLTVDGTSPRPNWVGVSVYGSGNTVGGPDPENRNVISGNNNLDVYVGSGSGHLVQGNRIGTNSAGTDALLSGVDGPDGVWLDLWAGGEDVRDNLVSGESVGIVALSGDNTIQHNDVGVDVTEAVAVPNHTGIEVDGDDNQVGGTGDADGNLVSGNDDDGVRLGNGATGNDVKGNVIGLTGGGDAALGNGTGVALFEADANTVGGSALGAPNVIAGNRLDGVALTDADDNAVRGNQIGLPGLGNGRNGVAIDDGNDNTVGGPAATAANVIAYNADDGVGVSSSDGGVSGVGNAIVNNSIHDNDDLTHKRTNMDDLGIDLDEDGITADDYNAQDADDGANHRQNDPDLTSASVAGIGWSLDSEQSQDYRLDFYANATCDPSGSGEGETWLGSQSLTTTGNAHQTGSFTPPASLTAGQAVTVTATKIVGGQLRSTSEFSPCMVVS